jgi:TetR/AcrR family transcriptional regulator, cholesterol catabolism regulator
LRTVAARVGVQMSTIYYYYPSKQVLLVTIMRRTLSDLLEATQVAIANISSPREQLVAAIRAYTLFHSDRRLEAIVTDSEIRALEPDNRVKIVKLRDEYERLFADILEAGSDAGEFHVDDIPVATFGLITMCSGVVTWYRPDGRLTLIEIADHFAKLALAGVDARTPALQAS